MKDSTRHLRKDGVTETASPDGGMFGLAGIESTIQRSPELTANRTCDDLMAALDVFRGGQPQGDDITLVAIRAE